MFVVLGARWEVGWDVVDGVDGVLRAEWMR
jgi:hypothetical protein